MRIVQTDNFGSDYPDEKFVTGLWDMSKEQADAIAKAINEATRDPMASRFWKVVPNDYKLQPGFEP
jgi:hypothetical protein